MNQALNNTLEGEDTGLSEDLLASGNQLGRWKAQLCAFNIVGLAIAEASWIFITITYYSSVVDVNWALGFTVGSLLVWTGLGAYRKYMSSAQCIFWVQGCVHTLMYALCRFFSQYHFLLCGSSCAIIFFMVLQGCLNKKIAPSKFYLYLYIWYYVVYYQLMKRIEFSANASWTLMIMMDVYCIMGAIVFMFLNKRWPGLSKIARWQVLCMTYPWSIAFVLCLAGSFPERLFGFKWAWFTIINHLLFLVLCLWVYRNREMLHPLLGHKQAPHYQMMLFQVSQVLLASEEDHLNYERESMSGGRPLVQCVLCMDTPSTYCYKNCKHVCICGSCIREWLSRAANQRCPICRTESQVMYEVKRLEGIYFAAVRAFRFARP